MYYIKRDRVAMGFYDGIGDFVCALPIISYLVNSRVFVTVFVSKKILPIIEHTELNSEYIKWVIFERRKSFSFSGFASLIKSLANLNVELFWVSPHSLPVNSSSLIGPLLFFFKRFIWKKTVILGSQFDRSSGYYDTKIYVDYKKNIFNREFLLLYALYKLKPIDYNDCFRLYKSQVLPRQFDLVIHAGASCYNRKLSDEFYIKFLNKLPQNISVAFVGLKNDIPSQIFRILNPESIVIGDFKSILECFRRARCVITMDSGFSHIASMVAKRHIAVFGSANKFSSAPAGYNSKILTTNAQLNCMPCDNYFCVQSNVECMDSIAVDSLITEIMNEFDR